MPSPIDSQSTSLTIFVAASLGYGIVTHWKSLSFGIRARKLLITLQTRGYNLKTFMDSVDTTNHPPTIQSNDASYENIYHLRKEKINASLSLSYENSGPLMILRGEGTRLIDHNDISYLDTRNNVAHVGHCHPVVVKAVQEQIAQLNTNSRYLHPNMCLLAERLLDLLPSPLDVVFFVNSGSEANDLALRLAYAKTGCKNTIVLDHAYHGHTLSTLAVSPYKYETSKEFDVSGDLPRNVSHVRKVPCPDIYRGLCQSSRDAAEHYSFYVEQACDEFGGKGNVSAFIMESGMRYVK